MGRIAFLSNRSWLYFDDCALLTRFSNACSSALENHLVSQFTQSTNLIYAARIVQTHPTGQLSVELAEKCFKATTKNT